jgi:hypothetical protein
MTRDAVQRLIYLCDTLPALLHTISRDAFTLRPGPDKWSRLEILGHLVDSAVNNHTRFIRVQFEEQPAISYDPDRWNEAGHYNAMSPAVLIGFWESYNRYLAGLMGRIPDAMLDRTCITGPGEPVTLAFLITDYVLHLEHHLKEITDYN